MSLTISPKTGRLIKTGSDEYYNLLNDPVYRKTFASESTLKTDQTPTVKPIIPLASLDRKSSPIAAKLPNLSNTNLPPLTSNKLPSLSSNKLPSLTSNLGSPNYNNLPENTVPMHQVYHQFRPDNLPLYNIPTLEKVLSKTPQPALRRDLEKMIERGKKGSERSERSEGRGIRTRGWKARAPKKGRERHRLMAECGEACFLKPDTEGFPICPRCSLQGECKCEIDCGGVQAAKIRAAQWKYPGVEAKADKMLKRCQSTFNQMMEKRLMQM